MPRTAAPRGRPPGGPGARAPGRVPPGRGARGLPLVLLLFGGALAASPPSLHAQSAGSERLARLTALHEEAGTAYRDGGPGDLGRALGLYRAYVEGATTAGIARKRATGLNGIGNVFREMGEPDSALHYLGCSLAISDSIGHRFNAAVTLMNIGRVYESLGEADSARAHYERGIDATGPENPTLLSRLRQALARVGPG